MRPFIALIAGLIFGLGLVISGMADPHKVLAFLDFTRDWDPSLALVMISALAIGFPAFAIARKRGRTLDGEPLTLPARGPITRQLIVGAALFGIGWGLSGLCPGPALVLAGALSPAAWAFVAAMAAGMLISRRWIAPRF